MLPRTIQELIKQFSSLPGVGPRMATRYIFYLLHQDHRQVDSLIKGLQGLKKIKLCSECFAPFNPARKEEKQCPICRDSTRNSHLLCVVEKETDLYSVEATASYRGLYFLIGPAESWFKRKDSSKKAKKLVAKIKKSSPKIKEVVLAVNYTAEGQALRSYLENLLEPFPIKITHIRQGLPLGSELEYADQETLRQALQERE